MIKWPAVLQYQGEDELIYIESLTDWLNDPDLCQSRYEAEDRLIDTDGALFSLPTTSLVANSKAFVSLGTQISVHEFVELVRKHAVVENYCCSAKINGKTHQQVIAMVKAINSL